MTAATRALPRPVPDPGPMPPRWIRSAHAHRYRHESGEAGVYVHPVTNRAMAGIDYWAPLEQIHQLTLDVAALTTWLARGGR